jgi:hypothetical protein
VACYIVKNLGLRDLDKNSFESKSRFGGLSLEEVVSSEGLERKTFVIHD